MENASKALIMAAGVLIGVMIISVLIYIFSKSADFASNYEKSYLNNELAKFNNKFEVYVENDNLTSEDIVSVINLAKDINMVEGGYKINVEIKLLSGNVLRVNPMMPNGGIENNQVYDFINKYTTKTNETTGKTELYKYRCLGVQYKDGRVNKIEFQIL